MHSIDYIMQRKRKRAATGCIFAALGSCVVALCNTKLSTVEMVLLLGTFFVTFIVCVFKYVTKPAVFVCEGIIESNTLCTCKLKGVDTEFSLEASIIGKNLYCDAPAYIYKRRDGLFVVPALLNDTFTPREREAARVVKAVHASQGSQRAGYQAIQKACACITDSGYRFYFPTTALVQEGDTCYITVTSKGAVSVSF